MTSANKLLCATFIFLLASTSALWAQGPVSIKEDPLVLPTYEIGPPDLEPMFYAGRDYQGAQGAIYPYALYETLLDERSDKTYQADYLENQYVKISVLPELGGRILSATDKTDGYDYVYRQTEIKPALIGMLGAWISGGVEWNIPHHHRASSYLPVDHRLVQNGDGSSTIWVGEVELRHRMQWAVGITLYPDKSYVKITTTLVNRTPYVHSFLDFTNTGVHANESYQVIFPPDTQYAVYHAKVDFAHWPLSHDVYQGVDYTKGVDLSWWKNHPTPVSFFCWNFQGNFFGGYDHGKDAGIISVQDHNVSPGAKFFEWGNGPEGRLWDKILDSQGDYLELMAGNFSDNQPDYSWIQPGETKTANQYWFPIRGIGGAKNANLNGAVNLEFAPTGSAHVGFAVTQEFRGAKVLLRSRDNAILEQTVDISPGKPFAQDVDLPAGTTATDLTATLLDATGAELLSYHPSRHEPQPMPPVVEPPPPPKDVKTVDELYRDGLRLVQFHNPALAADAYFQEALKRDPGNYDVNTTLGRLYCERGLFEEAHERLAAAVDRATSNYTRPKDGEAYYYLGVALRGLGRNRDAGDAFQHAAWSVAWTAASYFQLAELDGLKGDWAAVVADLDHSLMLNALNCRAWDLKAAALRKLERSDDAQDAANRALAIDPLDAWASHELELSANTDAAETKRGDGLQSSLELAVDYEDAGLAEDAEQVLKTLADSSPDADQLNPLVNYHLAYLATKGPQPEQASEYYHQAAQQSPNYVFPFRLEDVKVLEAAMRANPSDARAPYYLGNLLYDRQPTAAVKLWEKSAALDGSFALVHRNLALAYQLENDTAKAIQAMERAVQLDKGNARFVYELDMLYEAGNVPPQKRAACFADHESIVTQRSDAIMQQAKVDLLLGRYDHAIDRLASHHFHNWEGYGEIHDVYADALVLRGQNEFKRGKYQKALADYEGALQYPENLEVGQPYRETRLPQVNYFLGLTYEKLGNAAKARELLQQAISADWHRRRREQPEMLYYQGMAARKAGQSSEAGQMFDALISMGNEALGAGSDIDFFAKFGQRRSLRFRQADAHYLIGLGSLGKGDAAKARSEFKTARELNVNHLGATVQLAAAGGS